MSTTSNNDFTVICVECGEPRGFMQPRCPVCGSTQDIGVFEKALAEFEVAGCLNLETFSARFAEVS
jgi:hypothetical protein